MSKWGLLRGLGQGVAQAGTMLAADQFDRMKEERLEKYRQSAQQKQWERDDKTRAEDRTFQEQSELRGIAERAQGRIQDQANVDREFEQRDKQIQQSASLVERQLDQLDQQIEIGGIELEQVRGRNELRQKILAETDPDKRMQLMGDYASLANDFSSEPKTITAYGELDEATGQQTRTTMQWDGSSRSWIPINAPGQQSPGYTDDDIMNDLNGGQQLSSSGQNSQSPQATASTSEGLLRPQPPASPERDFVQTQREQQRTQAAENQRSRQEQSERESFDVILGRVNQGAIGDIPGRTQPNSGAIRRNIIANQEDLLRIIESPVATDLQKQQARNLLQSISGR